MTYEPSWIEEDPVTSKSNKRSIPFKGSRNTSEDEPKYYKATSQWERIENTINKLYNYNDPYEFHAEREPKMDEREDKRRVAKIRNYTELTHN